MMLDARQFSEFLRAEMAYLREPEPIDPPKCECCGIHPYDNSLYQEMQEGWCCEGCLEEMGYSEDEIEKMPRRDIYLSDWSDADG